MSTEENQSQAQFVPADQQTAEPTRTNSSVVQVEEAPLPSKELVANATQEQAAPEQPAVEQPATEQSQEQNERPRGWDRIDYNKIEDPQVRQQVEDRVNRLYRQVKGSQADWATFQQDYQAMQAKVKELSNAQVESVKVASNAEINAIKDQARQAFADGDSERGIELTQQLAVKQQEYVLQEERAKAEQQLAEQQAQNQQVPNAITDEEAHVILEWQKHHDFAQPGHPLQQTAIQAMTYLMETPEYAHLDLPEILEATNAYVEQTIDAMAGRGGQEQAQPAVEQKPADQQFAQQVLSNNYAGNPGNEQSQAATLNADQQRVARRLFPKLSAEEAYKQYASEL